MMKKQVLFLFICLCSFQLSAQIDITFRLNMKGQPFQFTTPEVNGTFNNWCGSCNAMTDADGDSIWEAVISLPAGSIEYKFSADNWANQESLVQGSPCTNFTAPSFVNRKLTIVSPTVLNPVCWGSCDTCSGGPINPGLLQISLPITWQDTANVNYTTTDFGGTFSSIAADPLDATKRALKIVKGNTAEVWAGTTLGTTAGFPSNIPFSISSTEMQARVFSPAAGTTFRLKVENKSDGSISCETDAVTTVANAWETLTFNFSSPASGTTALNFSNAYNKLSIFPNFGVSGAAAGEKIYYVADVAFGSITRSAAKFASTLSVNPNPSNGNLVLRSSVDFSSDAVISVQDLTGKTVWSGKAGLNGKTASLSLSSLENGLYILNLADKGRVSQSRISIMH
jgi:hypothetical protein